MYAHCAHQKPWKKKEEAMEEKNSRKRKQDMDHAVDRTEFKSQQPILTINATVRSIRDVPPAHYTLEAGGYKWKLCIHPNGNEKMNVKGHISCYLVIADTETLPPGWEVNVNFKLFVFDQIRDKYLTIQDAEGEVRRFHRLKTEWGFDHFLPLDTFTDASKGYLIDDCCVFGAEVFIIKGTGKGESASMVEDPDYNIYSWRIEKFSAVDENFLLSEEFVVGEHKWKLALYPKGNSSSKGKSLSLFLRLADCETLPFDRKVYAECKLRMKDEVHGNHLERKVRHWFCGSSDSMGYPKFMALRDLNDASKGFMVNDVVTIEAQITLISSFKDFDLEVVQVVSDEKGPKRSQAFDEEFFDTFKML